MPAQLGPAEIHIWYRATDALDGAALASELAILSAGERARYERFVAARDQRDFAAAHALTRRALSLYEDVAPADWAFEVTPEGKPFIPPGRIPRPLAFSLSHTHGLVACAVARQEVGLDVELVDRAVNERGISRRYFTPAEDAFINGCPEDQRAARFIELWTLKEAYIKAIGRGLRQPLDEFGFTLEGPAGIRFAASSDVRADDWRFALFAPLERARMAVAVRAAPGCRIVARADGGEGLAVLRQSAEGPGV